MTADNDQREIADNFIAALKAGQFVLYSQPIRPIGKAAGGAVYQEILVRFLEEEQKLLPPGGFFPLLEQHGLMATLDRWVVGRVIRWLRAARGKAHGAHCTINLSSDSILGAGFVDYVAKQLAGGAPAGSLHFEISEQDADRYALALDRLILGLRPLGCEFVVTGYTGETLTADLLQALGLSLLKIDGRIVRRIHEDAGSFESARAIHETCRGLGIRTIAELVEHRATLERLRSIGVDYAQGYGIARPAPLA